MLNGSISNLRVVSGTALYTSNFTVPTSPLTNVTNTQLLLSGTNGALVDQSMSNNLITNGSATISPSQFKYGASSMYFPGNSSSFVTIPDNTALRLGTSDFTVEFWMNPSNYTTQQILFSIGTNPTGSSYAACQLRISTGGILQFFSGTDGVNWGIASTVPYGSALTLNTWNHVGITRVGTVYSVYINGTLAGSATMNGILYPGVGHYIGAGYGGGYCFTGYIDDFRLTIGQSRYGFTVPTSAFPDM